MTIERGIQHQALKSRVLAERIENLHCKMPEQASVVAAGRESPQLLNALIRAVPSFQVQDGVVQILFTREMPE